MLVLPIDYPSHALHGFHHLLLGADAVAKPVGDVLAGDTQRRAVFHQADIVDVRHLGATDALVDPAYHVAEDALGVVVQLLLHFCGGPVGLLGQRDGQDVVNRCRRALGQLVLTFGNIDLVVVQRVQRGCGRRGYPGGVGAGQRVTDLLFDHRSHQVGHGPHALADLCAALEASGQTDVDVAVLVGSNPLGALDLALADECTGFHRGVDLVTGAVQKAGVDERDTLTGSLDAGLEVDRGATLLVHDPDFQGVALHAQQVFHTAKQLGGEGHFLGAMHLRLDDVDRAGAGVLARGVAIEVVQCDQAGHCAVHDAFGHFIAVLVEDGIVGHQMTDIAHEQQGAAMQRQARTVRTGILAIGVHGAGKVAATLGNALCQVAFHQTQPVAVDHGLVFGVYGCNRVLAVHDGGQGGLHQHVLDASGIGLADVAGRIDLDLEVQAVVLEQYTLGLISLAGVADQLGSVLEPGASAVLQGYRQFAVLDDVADRVLVGTFGQRCCLIKEGAGKGDHLVATDLVVAGALGGAVGFGDGIGAVESIVERTPARIRGIQRETGIHDRHDQLRTSHGGDLFIDIAGGGLEVVRLGQQIADFLQERLVGCCIVGLAGTLLMPGVNLCLQVVTLGEQGLVLRCQIIDQGFETGPEGRGVDAGAGYGLLIDEVVKNLGNLEAADLDAFSHGKPSLC